MEQTFEARFLSARRTVIAARFHNLNDMQREGVLTTQGPLLLLAGAGSGKTTVLINRIANLIAFCEGSDSNEIPEYITEEDVTYLEDYLKTRDPAMQQQAERLCALRPAAPWSILAITFTNKAANELKSRLQALLGDYAMDVWAMTFHAACCRNQCRRCGNIEALCIISTGSYDFKNVHAGIYLCGMITHGCCTSCNFIGCLSFGTFGRQCCQKSRILRRCCLSTHNLIHYLISFIIA